ncbi:MAG: polysaccharide biosynthesis/export family protein [Kofleriaceae bacterium]
MPRSLRVVVVLLAALLTAAAGCGIKVPTYDYSQEPDPRRGEYVLGVADDLTIHVWENDELSTDVTIRPDGTITLPLVGELRAAGETPSSLRDMIKARLADYIKSAGSTDTVTVALRQTNSYRFTVSGEVTRAGIFTSEFYVTVAEAVALAGGFTRYAKRNEMVLLRIDPGTGKARSIPLAYDLLASGKRPDMNLVLIAGDSIYVP